MKSKTKSYLWAMPLLMVALVHADGGSVPSIDPRVNQALMGEQQKFEMGLREERVAFNKKLSDDRKNFVESLKGKTVEEEKAAIKDFNSKQAKARSDFSDAQMQKRNEYRKSHGMSPLPNAEERKKAMDQRRQAPSKH